MKKKEPKNWEKWAYPYEKRLRREWEAEQQKQAELRQAAAKIPQKESYEAFRARWLGEQEGGGEKAEKQRPDQGGFVDLDAEIILPWRRTGLN